MRRHVVGAFVGVPILTTSSGATRSKNVSRSARTSRAAFSCMSNPAEVCRQNKVKSPAWTVMRLEPIQDVARDFNEPAATR